MKKIVGGRLLAHFVEDGSEKGRTGIGLIGGDGDRIHNRRLRQGIDQQRLGADLVRQPLCQPLVGRTVSHQGDAPDGLYIFLISHGDACASDFGHEILRRFLGCFRIGRQ